MDSLLWNHRSDVFRELKGEFNPAQPLPPNLVEEFWEEKFKRAVRKFRGFRKEVVQWFSSGRLLEDFDFFWVGEGSDKGLGQKWDYWELY